MAMSSTRLRDAIATALGVTDTAAVAAMGVLATAIILEITAHASVSTTVPGTGLAAPGGAGGPVTGVASGSGTVA